MPKIPQYKSQVTPSDPQFVPKDGSIYTPEAYGSGAGRVLTQAGRAISAKAAEMRDREDATRALEAANRLSAWEREYFHDPDKGIFAKQNGDAVGIYDEAYEAYRKKREEIMAGLGNDQQRLAFDRTSSASMNAKLQATSIHEQKQRQNWMVATAKQTVESKLSDITAAWADPNSVDVAIEDTKRSIRAMFPGMGEDYIGEVMKDFVSQAHVARIDAALKADRPDLARQIFRDHEQDISGSKRADVRKAVSDAELVTFVQDKSEEIFNRFGLDDEASANKWVREHFDGEKETKLLSAMEAIYVDQRRFRDIREGQVFDSVYEAVYGAETFQEAKQAVERSGLKAKYQDTLLSHAREKFRIDRTGKVHSDEAVLHEAKELLMEDGKLREKYPTWDDFYGEHKGKLSDSDLLSFKALYSATAQETRDRLTQLENEGKLFKDYPTFQSWLREFGDTTSNADQSAYHSMYIKAESDADPTITLSVKSSVNDLLDQDKLLKDDVVIRNRFFDSLNVYILSEQKTKGRPLSTSEQVELAKDLLEEERLVRKGWFNDVKGLRRYQIPPNAQKVKMQDGVSEMYIVPDPSSPSGWSEWIPPEK